MSPEQGWVSPSDIADMAGVSRGAVSNWRKRSADFPAPVGGSAAKPLFSVEEVGEWLKGRGIELKQDAGESRVWAAMNVLRGSLTVDEAADLLLSLLVARKTGRGEELAWGEVDDTTRRRVQEAIDSVDVDDLRAVADFALERLSKSQGKKGADLGFVGSRTATLLATLAAARPGGTLYDPACGIAAALLQAVTLGAAPDRIVGHDFNERALRIAGQRAELHDVHLELAHTDVLAKDADPELRADVIILEPPFGLRYPDTATRLTDPRFEFGTPPLTSADTAWLQHVVAHLSETGRGYVLTPHAVLSRDNEREIRAELVRQGCVETIIGLPGKLLPNITIPLALWVVRRPDPTAPDPRILFIDASEESAPEDLAAAWLSNPAARKGVPHVDIPIADVLAQDSQLSPRLWLTRTEIAPGEIAATYTEARRDIHATADLIQTLSAFPGPTNLPKSRVMTVGELLDEGVLEQSTGKPSDRYADVAPELQERIATAADVRDATLRRTALPEGHDQHPDLTHKGDVLVTTMNTIRARVDTTGGHLPATGVHRLRIVKEDILQPAYLATVLTGAWNNRFQAGTTIRRAALRNLEIPIIPPDDQTSIQTAAAALDLLHSTAQDLAARAATARTTLLDAIRHNAPLTPPEPPATPTSATPSPTEDGTMTTPAATDASTLADHLPNPEGAQHGN